MPRHKVRRPWLDYLVYLFVRTIISFAQMLTIEQSYALARFAAWIIYHVNERHRKIGCDNLELAFGDRYSPAERADLADRAAQSRLETDHLAAELRSRNPFSVRNLFPGR